MKKCIAVIFLLLSFSLCGFKLKKEKPVIMLSSAPVITNDNLRQSENIFSVGERISYIFYFPQGFGDNVIRMTLYKLDDKVHTLGYDPVRSRHITVVLGDKYIRDYFVIYQPGLYQVQFVESRKPDRIICFARFRVV